MDGRTMIIQRVRVKHTSLLKLVLRTTVAEVQQAYCLEHNYMRALDVAKQREPVQQRLCSSSFCVQCYL